jgi:dimeric dUTPase (all-alpha-NTP-PPase superfamily)
MIITEKTWEMLSQKQAELEQLIIQKRNSDLKNNSNFQPLVWMSCFNAKRLKLCLLVEIGEFANEIKSFKAWRKKQVIDWTKAKEELIDCLCFFLGLSNIYQIKPKEILSIPEKKDIISNELLLDFFYKSNNLYIEENEEFYKLDKREIGNKRKNTYYDWLKTFNQICKNYQIDEKQLITIYLDKNTTNQARAKE